MTITIPAAAMKARLPHCIPMTSRTAAKLKELRSTSDSLFIFTGSGGRRIQQPNNRAWLKTLERLELKDFRWHDLRHTWASWHVQAGTDLLVLQELGAWSTPAMVARYAHLSIDAKANAARQFELWRST